MLAYSCRSLLTCYMYLLTRTQCQNGPAHRVSTVSYDQSMPVAGICAYQSEPPLHSDQHLPRVTCGYYQEYMKTESAQHSYRASATTESKLHVCWCCCHGNRSKMHLLLQLLSNSLVNFLWSAALWKPLGEQKLLHWKFIKIEARQHFVINFFF